MQIFTICSHRGIRRGGEGEDPKFSSSSIKNEQFWREGTHAGKKASFLNRRCPQMAADYPEFNET